MSTPQEHKADAHQLTGDGVVELFEILPVGGGTLYLKANNDVVWQGHTWQGIGIILTGIERTADDQNNRPKLVIGNPDAVYSPIVRDGALNSAVVNRYEVLLSHILSNSNIYSKKTWRARRVPSLNRSSITLELRTLADGQYFMIPGRQFISPDFPLVTLQ